MANAKYAQVTDLLAQGRLRWANDSIMACLVQGATYDEADKVISDVGVPKSTVMIGGRYVMEGGYFMGQPAFFQNVQPGEYQVVAVQATGPATGNVLAWYDTNEEDGPLEIANTGTLVVRPALLTPPPDESNLATARVWMQV